jgi:predicted peroxiredoxin
MKKQFFLFTFLAASTMLFGQNSTETKMKKILIHVTQGPEDPTRAALAFLVAKSAIEDGHTVFLFLAGDGVQLFRTDVLDTLTGLGSYAITSMSS